MSRGPRSDGPILVESDNRGLDDVGSLGSRVKEWSPRKSGFCTYSRRCGSTVGIVGWVVTQILKRRVRKNLGKVPSTSLESKETKLRRSRESYLRDQEEDCKFQRDWSPGSPTSRTRRRIAKFRRDWSPGSPTSGTRRVIVNFGETGARRLMKQSGGDDVVCQVRS